MDRGSGGTLHRRPGVCEQVMERPRTNVLPEMEGPLRDVRLSLVSMASARPMTRPKQISIEECAGFWHEPLPSTRVLIVGIAPGRSQHELALQVMAEGGGRVELEQRSAFAGSIRKNLVSMLDDLGLNQQFGVATLDELFGTDLLATTSAVRDPVYVNGQD